MATCPRDLRHLGVVLLRLRGSPLHSHRRLRPRKPEYFGTGPVEQRISLARIGTLCSRAAHTLEQECGTLRNRAAHENVANWLVLVSTRESTVKRLILLFVETSTVTTAFYNISN
jgi:hypothetical protein